jgi:hypothetical protein
MFFTFLVGLDGTLILHTLIQVRLLGMELIIKLLPN